jgi:hypothetical protein
MANITRCPKCGNVLSDDLGGRCPECLLEAGFARSSAGGNGPETVDYASRSEAQATRPSPLPGEQFGGYRLVRALGQGGMGTVFEAEEQSTGRRLALKVLSHSLDSPAARQRFLREGRLAASVNHPHSVYVYGTEEIDGAPVITMELVTGGTLQERVRNKGPLPVADAVDAILQVIDGLGAAHAVGVLHRDVKPSNCFVDADGAVKIGDFGLSVSKIGRGDVHHLTTSGVFLGTPTFASPEQLRGDELDQRSDLYAVGVTLFYLLTGKVPFEGDQMVQLVATVLEKPAPNVAALNTNVPKELAAVVAVLLQKDPANRYRSYEQAKAALVPFSSLAPVPAPPARRCAAGAIDYFVLVIGSSSVSLVTALFVDDAFDLSMSRRVLAFVLNLTIWLLYCVLPEGILGATVGKWLTGLRVARAGTKVPPGPWRACLRTLLYIGIPAAPGLLYGFFGPSFVDAEGQLDFSLGDMWRALAVGLTAIPLWGLMFITMRRGNGFAAIHDLATGIRVIVRPVAIARPASMLAAAEVERRPNGSPAFGPYHVLAPLGTNAAGEWHLGYDARLLRKVWLRIVPVGAEHLPAALQNQARSGRIRWLTGRRGPTENWDAFEAPSGQPLSALLGRCQEWDDVRFWLLDLAAELTAATKDGTLPAILSLDQVWITADGRAKLCDLPAPESTAPETASLPTHAGAVEPMREFLRQVAAAALMGRPLTASQAREETFARPLPLHARPILDGLLKAQRPAVIAAELRANVAKPARVSRARRWAMFGAAVGVPVVVAFLPLLVSAPSNLAVAKHSDLMDLKDALYSYDNPFKFQRDASPEEKEALATYITGVFGERIEDPNFWKNAYLKTNILPQTQKAAKEIVAKTPRPAPEELAKATALVEPLIHRASFRAFGEWGPFLPLVMAFASLGVFLWLEALASVIAALIFRGGPLWSAFGIIPVNSKGKPASRLRFAWRQSVAWSSFLAAPILIGLIVAANAKVGIEAAIALAVVCGLVLLALIVTSTFLCKRSLPDRLAGTWLVVR